MVLVPRDPAMDTIDSTAHESRTRRIFPASFQTTPHCEVSLLPVNSISVLRFTFLKRRSEILYERGGMMATMMT